MSDPRTMDCEVWARREAKQLARTVKVQLIEIRPQEAYVIGGVRLPPNGELFWPSPPWHYHYAVFAQGLVRDEIYPAGLPLDEYKKIFEYHDVINFKIYSYP